MDKVSDERNIAQRHRFGGSPNRTWPSDTVLILVAFSLLCGIAAWFAHSGFGQMVAWVGWGN